MKYYGVWIDGKGDHYGSPVMDDIESVRESLLTTTDGHPDEEDAVFIWNEKGDFVEFYDHDVKGFIPYM